MHCTTTRTETASSSKPRSRGRLGVTAANIVLGNGSNDVLELVARAFFSRRTIPRSIRSTRSWSIRWRSSHRRTAHRGARREVWETTSMRWSVRGSRRHEDRLRRQPQQPHRHIQPLGRDPPLRGARAGACAHRAGRSVWRIPARRSQVATHGWIAKLRTSSCRARSRSLRPRGASRGLRHCRSRNRGTDEPGVRQPFNVNHLAMVGATAALDDNEFIEKSRAVNAAGLVQLAKEASSASVSSTSRPTATFITVRVGDAARIYEELLVHGVIVRPIAGLWHARDTCASPSACRSTTRASSRRSSAPWRKPDGRCDG